ncbi:alcohol dehydrogenase [Methylobacterium variabile]|uniref:Alcohol dehydrogenase n=1 Tax=Methylobacterium variabile TaxID=298794 RepID=A0A0J6T5S3_9HYPH|nr:alcohol dehydrogenase [Methylobacterium variabile]
MIVGLGVVGIAAAGAALAAAWRSEIAPVPPPAPASFDPALVRRGADLALIGDCRTCHTAPNGAAFAGGLPLPTPFGTLYSTNITPDPETGIGRWSQAAFARALRDGVDREGRHLYPAFPYDHYSATTDDDVRALYAFFMSRPAVSAPPPPNELPFPLTIRLTLAGWKLLFLRPKNLAPDPAKDEVWHRGRYLVEGLGHCGACHSPRNLLGAEITSRAYQGGEAEGWRAYALGAASRSPVPWDEAALMQYLRDGFHPLHGVARGPMAPVVENLAEVPREEVAAMARYLASLGAGPRGEAAATPSLVPASAPGQAPQAAGAQAAIPAAGTDLYAAACTACHEGGRPPPFGGISLALSTAISDESPRNLVNLILEGLPVRGGTAQPIMPGFGAVLTDAQVASLAADLRRRFGGGLPWPDLDSAIREARAARRLAARPAAAMTR